MEKTKTMSKQEILKEFEEGFIEEFGIHFKDSKGELQFALEFIEEAISETEKETRLAVIKEIENKFLNKFPAFPPNKEILKVKLFSIDDVQSIIKELKVGNK